MKAERKEVVLDLRELPREHRGKIGGQYPHIVEDKVYFQLEDPKQIGYAIRDGDTYIKPKQNIIITDSLAAHNWRVFIDTNPNTPAKQKHKAVGGYHVGKGYPSLSNCPISKEADVVVCGDPVWPNQTKMVYKDDYYHPRHANGLYVFVSPDGINWKEYHDKPVFSIFTECEDLQSGTLGLDWMPSIFFDHNINEYIIYLRANIALGCRHVMYSKSKDLINWTKPKLIKCNPEFDIKNKQNFYYSGVYPLGDKYIAFPPHFMNKIHDPSGNRRTYHNEHTPVMISPDGINWKTKGKILETNTGQHLYQPHVCTFREEDEFALYVHEGFQTSSGKLVRYTIDKNYVMEIL